MSRSLYEFCLAGNRPELLRQWHPTRNGTLTPKDIAPGSRKKVWWQCEKGHEWQASLNHRSRGKSCPICAGKIIVPGENDFASMYPDIAAQWHPTKNESLMPDQVSPFSKRTAWWICEKGHDFSTKIYSRCQRRTACPYCIGKKVWAGFNDLATLEPQLAKEWHPSLNGDLTPQMVTVGSTKKVWWQCSEGHVWCTCVYSRSGKKKTGCPVCSGRFKEDRLVRYADLMGEKP